MDDAAPRRVEPGTTGAEMTAPAVHRARLRYTEPMVREAVRTFMVRRVLGPPPLRLVALGLLATGAAAGWAGGPTLVTGFLLALLGLVPLLVAGLWWAHHANSVGRLRAMDPPEAELTLRENGISVASNLGAATIPWSSVTEVWELRGFWMLFLAPAQFITLPLDTLSPEAVAFARARLPARVGA